jgi:glycopeptide antibiotics resistance protein
MVALGLSLSIEAIQFVLGFLGNARAVDIDDVILNTLGALLGICFYKFLVASHLIRDCGRPVELSQKDRSADSIESADL